MQGGGGAGLQGGAGPAVCNRTGGKGMGGGDRRNRKGVGAEERGQVHEEGNISRRNGARTICCRSLIQVEECNTVNDLQCESQQDEECEDVSNLPSTALHYTT